MEDYGGFGAAIDIFQYIYIRLVYTLIRNACVTAEVFNESNAFA